MDITSGSGERVNLSINVRSLSAFLDVGGSPLTDLRLHPDVSERLLDDAEDADSGAEFRVSVDVGDNEFSREADVGQAVHEHFERVAARADHDIRDCMRDGVKQLLVALGVVATLVVMAEALEQLGEGRLYRLFGESLVIIGWVTLWGPAEKLFFAHIPMRRRRRVARALARCELSVQPAQK